MRFDTVGRLLQVSANRFPSRTISKGTGPTKEARVQNLFVTKMFELILMLRDTTFAFNSVLNINARKRKSYFNCKSSLFKTAHHITTSNLVIPFLGHVPILYPLKRPMGTLARNGLFLNN